MSPRTPEEVRIINDLVNEINAALTPRMQGVDRQLFLDALEYVHHHLLIECADSRESVEYYVRKCMCDRALGAWDMRHGCAQV